jgi:hypothetical protein
MTQFPYFLTPLPWALRFILGQRTKRLGTTFHWQLIQWRIYGNKHIIVIVVGNRGQLILVICLEDNLIRFFLNLIFFNETWHICRYCPKFVLRQMYRKT